MGEYFRGVILKPNYQKVKKVIEYSSCSWDYDMGSKIMEHSYSGNDYVRSFEYLLANQYYGFPFAWVGDYADNVYTKKYSTMTLTMKNRDYFNGGNSAECVENLIELVGRDNFHNLVTNGSVEIPYDWEVNDFIENNINGIKIEGGIDLYSAACDYRDGNRNYKAIKGTIPAYEYTSDFLYAVNLDKKEYVRIHKYVPNRYNIHPLPLLCATGHSRGGGCYKGPDMVYIGSWAFDRIGVTNDKKDIKGFKKITPKFKCDW